VVGQFVELVVVRGKERLGTSLCRAVQVLDDSPRYGDPVEGTGATPQLVKEDQAARGQVVEDAGSLLHLNHKGGLAHGDIVRSTHTGVDRVDDADGG